MNSIVAACALIVRTRPMESAAMPAPRDHAIQEAARPLLVPFGTALWLAFGGGFVALSYEILFFRVTSFLTGSNPAALPLVLGAFIIGLAGGAREAGRLCATSATGPALKRVMRGLAVAVIAALIFLPLLRWIAPLHLFVALGTGLFLIYVSGRNWGLLFPYLVDRSVATGLQAGKQLSFLYLANILGSAAGAVLTGFVLTDWVGLRGLGLILGAIAAAVTLLAVRALAADRSAWRPLRAWAGAVAALLVLHLPLTEGLIGAIQLQKSAPLVEAVENRSGIVTVDELERVFGNGMYDGQFNIGLDTGANNIERAYAIALYHPAPRRVLVIGMSSGSWSQVIANWDSVQSVTIVEINPGYARLIAERSIVASLLHNPKVTLVIDDGRRWLRRNPQERFDAVIANTSIHFRANASNVLSLEFMDLVRRHLNPGGVLFYNTTGSMRSLRTGCVAFRHGVRIEAFAAVSDQPLQIDADRWIRTLMRWRIDGKLVLDLTRDGDRKLLDRLKADVADLGNREKPTADRWIEDCPSILARSEGFVPITDDNMGTEWRTNLGMVP
jgi:spermidine synthase